MNKISKVCLLIIFILSIALVITTYYWMYYRNAYFNIANEIVQITQKDDANK